MHKDVKVRNRKKTGKRFFISISCLILLSWNLFLLTYAAGLGIEGKGRENAESPFPKSYFFTENVKGDNENWEVLREVGGYDNPIDDFYLSALCYRNEADEYDTLSAYEAAWRDQLFYYVENCGGEDRNTTDKGAVGEYMKAVVEAVRAQKNFMKYMGVEQERIIWYSAQIYRHAFVKDIKGEITDNGMMVTALNWEEGSVKKVPGKAYEVYGEFANEIDKEFLKALYTENDIAGTGGASELTVKDNMMVGKSRQQRQESFDINWCNQLCKSTMEFYEELEENLDEEGKRLLGIWQESRENWKRASNEYFLNAKGEADTEKRIFCSGEEEIFTEIIERDGWINRLYFLQLQSIKETL